MSVFGSSLNKGRTKAADVDLTKVDEVANQQGFVSREAHQRRNYVGPTKAMNTKLPVEVYDRFMKFCDEENLTIRKGIERLLDQAGK
ncbi:hypothetical protein NKW43_15085 [Gluconobacter albidus]|uniref:hypothetical protein n=1 Tax=Gluconobacter albidus TaxID=318683 RepID=UPI0020A1C7FB|nr:hypothetical protein [Gluconobacter albidus]MCP1274985.1 hypothetical protein [Gluconobacter albidus]